MNNYNNKNLLIALLVGVLLFSLLAFVLIESRINNRNNNSDISLSSESSTSLNSSNNSIYNSSSINNSSNSSAISSVQSLSSIDSSTLKYTNKDYGFEFILPQSWNNYKATINKYSANSSVCFSFKQLCILQVIIYTKFTHLYCWYSEHKSIVKMKNI